MFLLDTNVASEMRRPRPNLAVPTWFENKSIEIAETAGFLTGTRQRAGKPLAMADALIAATAMKHRLVLVTRNVEDFVDLPLDVYEPWVEKLILGDLRR